MFFSSKVLKEINKFINKNFETYKILTHHDYNKIQEFLDEINKKYNTSFNITSFTKVRNTYMYFLSKTKGVLTSRYGDNIMEKYKNNEPIICIAELYKLPPKNVLYQILIELKIESHIINKLLTTNINKLPKNIQTQLQQITLSDPKVWISNDQALLNNKINCIYNKIKELNIPFKYDINNKSYPTILFESSCKYKNITFTWIDIKKYILFDNDKILNDIDKTISKYSRYGIGLILFEDIICSKSFINKIKNKIYINSYSFFD